MSRLSEVDVILICVPTPLTGERDPDLQYVVKTTETIAKFLSGAQLVVLESTTYPGTTRDVMLPLLEQTGKRLDTDFFLAYSPEREDPCNVSFTARQIPKVGEEQVSLVSCWQCRFIRVPWLKLYRYQVAKSRKPVRFLRIRIAV